MRFINYQIPSGLGINPSYNTCEKYNTNFNGITNKEEGRRIEC